MTADEPWRPMRKGLYRSHPLYGPEYIQVEPCKRTPGNICYSISSGVGVHYRGSEFSISPDALKHLNSVVAAVLACEDADDAS